MLFAGKTWTVDSVRTELEKIIRSIMKSYEKEELGDQTALFFEQLDSLRMIELVVLTEKKFKIQFPQDTLASLSDQKMETFAAAVTQLVLEA